MRLWCKCGRRHLWAPAWSPCTSQHLLDPYTFAHAGHGLIIAAILNLAGTEFLWQLLIAGGWGLLWEWVENRPWLIARYRSGGQPYDGDSLANSAGDIAACVLGFLFGWTLEAWQTGCVLGLTEVMLTAWIRDCNALNVALLLWQSERVKRWQARCSPSASHS